MCPLGHDLAKGRQLKPMDRRLCDIGAGTENDDQ